MGLVISENFGYLLDPGLRKIFMDEYTLPDSQIDTLYGMEKSSKAVEYDYAIGGIGDMTEFTGTIPYTDFDGQYRVSYTHREWVNGMKIERKLVDDDQYSVINKRPMALAVSAKRTREKHGASVFNSAFNTSVFAGGDTYALCASAHSYVGTATTQSNTGTAALSATSLATARLAMRDFVDEKDNLITARGTLLLVPPELEQIAYEITQSEKKPTTANNDINFIKSLGYKVVVWDYLTDTNNWFLIDEKYAKMYLKWFDRIPTEFNKDKDFDTYISKWSVYNRYTYGFSSWTWIYGNAVS
jgi:phage major head subunit gpT-like protein